MNNSLPPTGIGTSASVLTVRVYYEDTDAAGVVYYANYLRFCERARTEWLRAHGVDQQRMMDETGIAFVVSRVEARYRAPARLDDCLIVHSRVDRMGGASVVFSQDISRGAERIFESTITIACVNTRLGRPTPLPAELRNKVNP